MITADRAAVEGTIVASGVSGTRTVITSVVIFKGALRKPVTWIVQAPGGRRVPRSTLDSSRLP
jgi:hypothetical protein